MNVTVTLEGEYDAANSTDILHQVDAARAAGATHITFDLGGVRFLDSRGVGAIVLAARSGLGVAVRNEPPHIRRVLEVSGVYLIIEGD